LRAGDAVAALPFLIQGPWALDFDRQSRNGLGRIENGALTVANPPSMRRLQLWKRAAITVAGRPDWLFIKLDTHGMYPTDTETILGNPAQNFLRELINRAADRQEILHFVSAREMANIALAACDGHNGNPGDYRDYRYRLQKNSSPHDAKFDQPMTVRA
jgi:hypothetical protein